MSTTVKSYPTIKQGIGLALYFLLFSLISGYFGASILNMFNVIKIPSMVSLSTLTVYCISALLTIWIGAAKINGTGLAAFKLKFNRVAPIVILIGVVMMITQAIVMESVESLIPMPDLIRKMFDKLLDKNISAFITAVIAAPVLEEILFRGIILDGFLKKYSPTKAIIVSALIFSLMHLNPWQAIPSFFAGVLMGWLYWKTNSIIPGMILHFMNNLTFMLLKLALPNAASFKSLTGPTGYIALLISCLIITITGYWYLNNYFKLNAKAEEPEQSFFDDTIVSEVSATPTIVS